MLTLAHAAGNHEPQDRGQAPAFELEEINGETVSSANLLADKKLVLVNFWMVGCRPCNEELVHLQDLSDEFKNQGLAVVVVASETSLTRSQVAPFFTANKYTLPVLMDYDRSVLRRF